MLRLEGSTDQAFERLKVSTFEPLLLQIPLEQGVKFGKFRVGLGGLIFLALESAAFQVLHEFMDHDGKFFVLIHQGLGHLPVDISLIQGHIKLAADLAATSLGNGKKLDELLVAATFIALGDI